MVPAIDRKAAVTITIWSKNFNTSAFTFLLCFAFCTFRTQNISEFVLFDLVFQMNIVIPNELQRKNQGISEKKQQDIILNLSNHLLSIYTPQKLF